MKHRSIKPKSGFQPALGYVPLSCQRLNGPSGSGGKHRVHQWAPSEALSHFDFLFLFPLLVWRPVDMELSWDSAVAPSRETPDPEPSVVGKCGADGADGASLRPSIHCGISRAILIHCLDD